MKGLIKPSGKQAKFLDIRAIQGNILPYDDMHTLGFKIADRGIAP